MENAALGNDLHTATGGAIANGNATGASEFSWVLRLLWRGGAFTTVIVAIAVGFLFAKQDALLYFPEIADLPRRPGSNPRGYRTPAEYKIPFETHMIRCDDGVSIHAWLLFTEDAAQRPTLIFFHGNAGNIGLRLPNAHKMMVNLKVNILMVEYRGYGDSDTVTPNEAGLQRDAEAALRFLASHERIDPTRIFLFGRSLGGAVAFHLAHYAQRNAQQLGVSLQGLIVENTFLSIARMVDHLMPWVAPLKPLVLRIKWESGAIAPHLQLPVLYLAGSADPLVPHEHMKELYRRSSSPGASICPRIFVVDGGTHNETWLQGGKAYWERIRSFLVEAAQVLKTGGGGGDDQDVVGAEGTVSQVAVEIGGAGEVGAASSSSSSIPLMPSSLLGMAKEAASSGSTRAKDAASRTQKEKDT